jgi:hypothetical protein
MNYKRAIREALRLFPSQLEVAPNKPNAPSKAHSPSLSKAWSSADDLSDRQSEWHYIAVWAVGCALHRAVQQAADSGSTVALKSDIDMRYVEHKFAQSLLTPNTWFPRHIKRAYRRDRALRGVPPLASVAKLRSPKTNALLLWTLEPNAPGVNLQNPAFAPQPNIALQLTPTASLLVPSATLRRR